MIIKRLLLLYLGVNIFIINIFSQDFIYETPVFYKIASVYNFKKSIVSITFDDGAPVNFSIGVPLLNERSIPATFYVISRDAFKVGFRDTLINANKQHEIGSHTFNHRSLIKLDKSEIEYELKVSQEHLNSLLGSNHCLTIAYPGGHFNDSVREIVGKYYIAGRIGLSGYNDLQSYDRFALRGVVYVSSINISDLNSYPSHALDHGKWLIEIFHGIENEGYQPIKKRDFIKHLDFLKLLENNIWIAKVSDAIKYLEERKHAKIICNECDDNKFYKIRLDDQLNDTVFSHPLSISIKIPESWQEVSVSGAEYIKTVNLDGNNFVYINAMPNNEEIVIRPDVINTKSQITRIISIEPNPFNSYVDVWFETPKPSEVIVSLKNINGELLETKEIFCDQITSIRIPTENISKGTYIMRIFNKTSNEVLARKVLKLE